MLRYNNRRISVFITSYNQKDYLVPAIESVIDQTIRPFEIIIADDCSTDGSQEIIKEYTAKYPDLIRPFYHDQNMGISKNKSFALEQVQGDLVTYLDGDDRFLPSKLETEVKCFNARPNAKIVYSNIYLIDPAGQRLGLWAEESESPPVGCVFKETFCRDFPRRQLFRNELIDYECLKTVGFFDSDLAMYEDWDLRIRLTKHYQVAYCSEPLAEYRRHDGSISKLPFGKHFDEMRKVYEKNAALLSDFSAREAKFIERKVFSILSYFARNAIVDELEQGNRRGASERLRNSKRFNSVWTNLVLHVLLLLPRFTLKPLKTLYGLCRI